MGRAHPAGEQAAAAATEELGYYADYPEATKHMERITAAEFNKPASEALRCAARSLRCRPLWWPWAGRRVSYLACGY